jgi:hypothetical protein
MGQMGKFCRRDFKGSLELQLPIECIADIVPSRFLCRSQEGAKVLVKPPHKS